MWGAELVVVFDKPYAKMAAIELPLELRWSQEWRLWVWWAGVIKKVPWEPVWWIRAHCTSMLLFWLRNGKEVRLTAHPAEQEHKNWIEETERKRQDVLVDKSRDHKDGYHGDSPADPKKLERNHGDRYQGSSGHFGFPMEYSIGIKMRHVSKNRLVPCKRIRLFAVF